MAKPTFNPSGNPSSNLYGARFKRDPYPTYAALRRSAPVSALPPRPAAGDASASSASSARAATWFVTNWAEAEAVLRDHRTFVKDFRSALTPVEARALPPEPPLVRLFSRHMLNADGAEHLRLRTLVNQAFTVQRAESMRGRIEELAAALVDKFAARGQVDLIREFAYPLPIYVIADLLGIPSTNYGKIRNWSSAFVSPQMTASDLGRKAPLLEEFLAFLRTLFRERRQTPRDDLLSALVAVEEEGRFLSEDDLCSMVILLIKAGHETSAHQIGNAVLALLQHPEQLAALQSDPSRLPHAVEELLRFDGPIERATTRYAAADVVLGGASIRRGDTIHVVLAAANRDDARHACPDQLDLARGDVRHLGFGLGPHYCLGAPLARIEGQVALRVLFERLPNLRLAVTADELRWRTRPILRGLKQLPVAWDVG